ESAFTMSKCAREECGKTVYQQEELKCLDKVWHKICFKCTVCGMALNMKNYKGYNKMPYCDPHYPKTVSSVISDTPEMRRLAENTKNQSQIAYHADYEKMKGTKTEIADDPEIQRHKKNTQVQSSVQYTGEKDKRKIQEDARPQMVSANEATGYLVTPPPSSMSSSISPEPGEPSPSTTFDSPYSARLASQNGALVYSSDLGGSVDSSQPSRAVGSIADYDPLNGQWGSQNTNNAAAKIGDMMKASQHKPEPVSPPEPQRIVSPASQSVSLGGRTLTGTGQAGFAVKAIYDYTAADKDEVSFIEGDVIVNCAKVDDGWMTGTVQRTLQWGMLPANYVESYKQPTGLHRIH
ncbi:hypothetical protein PFISCL1PPCAC_10615, partial [Pristionchus fissidentatus]